MAGGSLGRILYPAESHRAQRHHENDRQADQGRNTERNEGQLRLVSPAHEPA
jgi:hypothetical protein